MLPGVPPHTGHPARGSVPLAQVTAGARTEGGDHLGGGAHGAGVQGAHALPGTGREHGVAAQDLHLLTLFSTPFQKTYIIFVFCLKNKCIVIKT